MSASKEDIKKWIEFTQKNKFSHLIIITDTFDHSNFPVFVRGKKDCKDKLEDYGDGEMIKIEEVYDMSKNIEEQLNEIRSWNI